MGVRLHKVVQGLLAATFFQSALIGCSPKVCKPRTPSVNINWSENVRVMASCGQDFQGFINESKKGEEYIPTLVRKINDPEIAGFEEAHEAIESSGYFISNKKNGSFIMYPTSSFRKLNCWRKVDREKKRFVLLLGQISGNYYDPSSSYFSLNRRVKSGLNDMENILKDPKLYNVPPENIHRYNSTTQEIFREEIEWLGKMLSANPGSEGMILYMGHGDILSRGSSGEGSAVGLLGDPYDERITVTEDRLKEMVNSQIGSIASSPVLIIIDACYSGAFVAFKPENSLIYNHNS